MALSRPKHGFESRWGRSLPANLLIRTIAKTSPHGHNKRPEATEISRAVPWPRREVNPMCPVLCSRKSGEVLPELNATIDVRCELQCLEFAQKVWGSRQELAARSAFVVTDRLSQEAADEQHARY